MKLPAAFKYLIAFLLLAILGVLLGAGYQYFFAKIRIAKTPIVANETALSEYLAMGPGRGITSLDIIQQNFWKETDECIAEAIGEERVFCFESFTKDGKFQILVYPNEEQINNTNPQVVNRLLNLNILSILEKALDIDPSKKNLILDYGESNYIFRW